jgi:hypothetical protein
MLRYLHCVCAQFQGQIGQCPEHSQLGQCSLLWVHSQQIDSEVQIEVLYDLVRPENFLQKFQTEVIAPSVLGSPEINRG